MPADDAGRLLDGREWFARDLRDHGAYWYFSPITYTLRRALTPLIGEFCSGRTLDAGAGGLHARRLLMPHCDEYVSVDVAEQRGELDLHADVQDLSIIGDEEFDCVYCSQVLEHLPRLIDLLLQTSYKWSTNISVVEYKP